MKRYAFKLLFQYLICFEKKYDKKRLCEISIINLEARNAKTALKKVKRYAKEREHDYFNDAGSHVFFQFVGIVDMIRLGIECGPNEVWYDIVTLLEPMERKEKLTLSDEQLITSKSVNEKL
jgi:hypothetical protein